MWPPKQGLDIRGGMDLVLEARDMPDYTVTRSDLERTRDAILRRIDRYGLAEPVVVVEGDRRIRIQLPEVEDVEEAREIIGRTAMLTFRDPSGEIILTGENLTGATAGFDPQTGGAVVHLTFDSRGRDVFYEATRRLSQRPNPEDRRIAIYLDEELVQNPVVNQPIDRAPMITGYSSIEEARRYALLLQMGALPIPMEIVMESSVHPVLGEDAVQRSVRAGIAGVALVLLFMLFNYKFVGLIADIGLLVYIVFYMAALMRFGATLTLPGIAGLILSLGMAVDANVIIFERIKEEINNGKRLRAAIDSGFSRAIRAIVDANITTLITAGVLLYYGTGPVQGFAVTLSIGILCSMFTAIFITKLIMNLFVDRDPVGSAKYFTG